jgi:Family of unknown function (DUF5681)
MPFPRTRHVIPARVGRRGLISRAPMKTAGPATLQAAKRPVAVLKNDEQHFRIWTMTHSLDDDPVEKSPDDGLPNKPKHSAVGYCRPPEHGRFPKGRSPNRKGRPKRKETWAELFKKELNKRIWVVENGKRIRITKRRAWMKRIDARPVLSSAAPRRPSAVTWLRLHEL